jgi:hypothetical protein
MLDPETLATRYEVVPDDPLAKLVHGSDFPIPITPGTFAGHSDRAERRALLRKERNPLQRDIGLKRLAGLPDAVLERGAVVLGLGEAGRPRKKEVATCSENDR